MAADTRDRILDGARACLLEEGYANLSTRPVAARAGVPLSQIHYHFGGKQGLVLALLQRENERLLARQRGMYSADEPLWRRYDQACDFLEEDLASGYVRMLQEMIAAGWSDPAIATQVSALLGGWLDLLEGVATEAESELGGLGPMSAPDVAMLVGLAFLGAESQLLLDDRRHERILRALRSVVGLIKRAG
jgi:AcrR family transcriptional regulator